MHKGMLLFLNRKIIDPFQLVTYALLCKTNTDQFQKICSNNFSAQFIKIISHYKKIGYNINVLQQTACLVVNPIMIGNFAFLFNCKRGGSDFKLYDASDLKTYMSMRW